MKTGILLCGLPGAGKTAAAELLYKKYGGSVWEAGATIRKMFREEIHDHPTSDDLGRFAAKKRETDGPGFYGDRLVKEWERRDNIEYPVIVDSVRHINGAETIMAELDLANLIWIEAPREDRLSRIQDRGRDDEATFSADDLADRDHRELMELGAQTLLDSGRIDDYVMNDGGLVDLAYNLATVVSVAPNPRV